MNFEDFNFVELKREDMKELDHYDGRSITESELKERMEGGHICFALKSNNNIAAFSWCNPNYIHNYGAINRTLNKSEAYLYDAQTLYNFRQPVLPLVT